MAIDTTRGKFLEREGMKMISKVDELKLTFLSPSFKRDGEGIVTVFEIKMKIITFKNFSECLMRRQILLDGGKRRVVIFVVESNCSYTHYDSWKLTYRIRPQPNAMIHKKSRVSITVEFL
jgi:hypothetical protein